MLVNECRRRLSNECVCVGVSLGMGVCVCVCVLVGMLVCVSARCVYVCVTAAV